MTKKQAQSKLLTIENVDFLLLSALMISFFLHYRVNGFIAMLIIIFAILKFFARRLPLAGSKGLLFFPLIFILLIIGQSYTVNLKEGWILIERNLSLLVLPFALQAVVGLSVFQRKTLANIFIASAFVTALFCLGLAGFEAVEQGSIYALPNNTHFLYNRFMHHRLTDPIGMHAVYFSLFISVSSMILLARLLSVKMAKWKMGLTAILFLFFCVLIYLLKSANLALGFVLCSVLVLLFYYGSSILQRKKSMAIFSGLLIVLALFAYKGIQSKLENFSLSYDMADEQITPIGIRLSIWECTWQVIKENVILGTGTGDAHHELIKKYQENNFVVGYQNDFNSHNMFLQYWMGNGLPILLTFITGIFFLFRKAIRSKNVIFLSFLILFTLFSLTESTMRTQKGMLFFVTLASLFYWSPSLWTPFTKAEEKARK